MTAPLSRAMALPMRDEWRKWGFLALTLLALGMGYAATLGEMVHVWRTSETYAHGFLIAPIALWLLHRQRAMKQLTAHTVDQKLEASFAQLLRRRGLLRLLLRPLLPLPHLQQL